MHNLKSKGLREKEQEAFYVNNVTVLAFNK